ncbi:MAG TPA: aminopeptidase P family protein [Chloroflexi bacterium]|nr:aminopeptidase P family protein [Chloroflexota bacterium]
MNISRVNNLCSKLASYNLDYAAILPGATMRYLTGLDFHLMERPIVAFFSPQEKPALIAPEFECSKVKSPDDWQLFPWRDEEGVEGAFEACCQSLNLSGKRIGVEELVMRVKEYALLQTFAPGSVTSPLDPLVAAMRSMKDASEIEHIRAAVKLAEGVLQDALSKIKIGMSEKEVAAELLIGLLRAGSETPLPFEPLVQTGITGASPHAPPGDRKLTPGDLLIIDFGGRVKGYASDITRTFAVGQVSDETRRIYNLVAQANRAGREVVRPGLSCQDVDRATRKVIADAGYGQYFTHRTGHGLGLDAHEPPFIVEGDITPLQAGMTFTVEPGIYIPKLGGARIEDDVLVTVDGLESLTTFSRELIIVG